jgi:hypothetical protein
MTCDKVCEYFRTDPENTHVLLLPDDPFAQAVPLSYALCDPAGKYGP